MQRQDTLFCVIRYLQVSSILSLRACSKTLRHAFDAENKGLSHLLHQRLLPGWILSIHQLFPLLQMKHIMSHICLAVLVTKSEPVDVFSVLVGEQHVDKKMSNFIRGDLNALVSILDDKGRSESCRRVYLHWLMKSLKTSVRPSLNLEQLSRVAEELRASDDAFLCFEMLFAKTRQWKYFLRARAFAHDFQKFELLYLYAKSIFPQHAWWIYFELSRASPNRQEYLLLALRTYQEGYSSCPAQTNITILNVVFNCCLWKIPPEIWCHALPFCKFSSRGGNGTQPWDCFGIYVHLLAVLSDQSSDEVRQLAQSETRRMTALAPRVFQPVLSFLRAGLS